MARYHGGISLLFPSSILSSLPEDVLVCSNNSIDIEKYPVWFLNRALGGPELNEPDDCCLQVTFCAQRLLARALRATRMYIRLAVLQRERLLTSASTKRFRCSANLASIFERFDRVEQVNLYACARAGRSACLGIKSSASRYTA